MLSLDPMTKLFETGMPKAGAGIAEPLKGIANSPEPQRSE